MGGQSGPVAGKGDSARIPAGPVNQQAQGQSPKGRWGNGNLGASKSPDAGSIPVRPIHVTEVDEG